MQNKGQTSIARLGQDRTGVAIKARQNTAGARKARPRQARQGKTKQQVQEKKAEASKARPGKSCPCTTKHGK